MKQFLGTGWRFPLIPDENGKLAYSSGDDNVEQSLRILLQTSLGERVMRFEFGCRASEMVFAPGGHRYLRMLETSVEEAIRDWEPRIDVLEIRAESVPAESERVDVFVAYRIRASNTKANLVFPFYLDEIAPV